MSIENSEPSTSSIPRRPRVVVVGGGFGGVEATKALARAPVDVTLIDRRNYHLFQPLLYQIATAVLPPSVVAWPIRSIFAGQPNVEVVMLEIDRIDCDRGLVAGGSVTVPFDYLVVATGATHAYFGHDAWASFAPGLKTVSDAGRIRERLLRAFEQAELIDDPVARARLMTAVVVGGGATGVEMAGAIAELTRSSFVNEFRRVDPRKSRTILIEAGPRILPAFQEPLAELAHRSLEKLGVEVYVKLAVTECDSLGVSAGDKRFDAETVVWAAGVKASPAAAWLGAAADGVGRVKVDEYLSVPDAPHVFVIGDTASLAMPDGKPVPGVAPAAKQMGTYVGHRIAELVAGKGNLPPFRYHHQGDLATIGRSSAIVSMGKLKLSGMIGWLTWCLAHIFFLIGFRSRIIVSITWIWNFFTMKRGARIIEEGELSGHDSKGM
jgi:NADH:ubiquinone reductase (H+-translocating)